MSKLVPKLRFKEFSGEWEEKQLFEIGKIITGTTPLLVPTLCVGMHTHRSI